MQRSGEAGWLEQWPQGESNCMNKKKQCPQIMPVTMKTVSQISTPDNREGDTTAETFSMREFVVGSEGKPAEMLGLELKRSDLQGSHTWQMLRNES